MVDKKEPAYQQPAAAAPTSHAQAKKQHYQEQNIVAVRASRDGDPGYQLNTPNSQVTIILEDGTEKVINPNDIDEVKKEREKQEKETYEKEKQDRERQDRERK